MKWIFRGINFTSEIAATVPARAAMRSHLRGVIDDLLAATEHEVMARARSEIDARRSTVARRIELSTSA